MYIVTWLDLINNKYWRVYTTEVQALKAASDLRLRAIQYQRELIDDEWIDQSLYADDIKVSRVIQELSID